MRIKINRNVLGSSEPDVIEIRIGSGERRAILRKGIVNDWHDADLDSEHGQIEFWKWDEIEFATDMSEADLAELSDALWYQAERQEMQDIDWRADVDSALLDLMEMAVG